VGVDVQIYFKLFNSIKDQHEVELARLEIESLVGPVEIVRNFADEIVVQPFATFINTTQVNTTGNEADRVRFQDYLMHELPYGEVQGFVCKELRDTDIGKLVRRLGYTREIYVVIKRGDWKEVVKDLFPEGVAGKNYNAFCVDGTTVVRAITHQYFLEKSEYVTKVTPSLEREKLDFFIERLFDNLMCHVYRIPASSKARVGKRFLDYLAEREEPSLYLAHGLHPYKGKFHPKMTRALVNLVYPKDKGTIMDNFAGSGTLLVEASMMGLDSYGTEINPMSVLMTNAKCALLRVEPHELDKAIQRFLRVLTDEIVLVRQKEANQTTLDSPLHGLDSKAIDDIRAVAPDIYEAFQRNGSLDEIVIARTIAQQEFEGDVRNLLMLAIAIAISDIKGQKARTFSERIPEVLEDVYRRGYVFHRLKSILKIPVGYGVCFNADSTNLQSIPELRNIDANVNSPPYSTAIDYIRNDLEQLVLLGFVRTSEELARLEQKMGGNPRARYDTTEMREKIHRNAARLPPYAIRVIRLLEYHGRHNHAFRLYKFYAMLKRTLEEQRKILRRGALIATVIGNNHFKLTDNIESIGMHQASSESGGIPVTVHDVVNNLRSVDLMPIAGDQLLRQYGNSVPVRVSISVGSNNIGRNGIYVEVENERVTLLLGKMVGFKPEKIINRYLEKTLRGNIRYESIVIMRNGE